MDFYKKDVFLFLSIIKKANDKNLKESQVSDFMVVVEQPTETMNYCLNQGYISVRLAPEDEIPVEITKKGMIFLESIEKSFILNNTSDARAVGEKIIKDELYKKWGKSNNIKLLKILQESIDFYRTKIHPTSRLDEYNLDVSRAISKYYTVVDEECFKINNYKLVKPVKVYSNNTYRFELLEIKDKDNWYFVKHENKTGKKEKFKGTINGNKEHKFVIDGIVKVNLVNNYYRFKSQSKKV